MKRKHLILIAIGFAVWLTETAAFGWNSTPHSYAEAHWDGLGIVIILWGIIGDILSNVEFHKNYYKYKETNITTRKVEVKGDNPKIDYNFGTTKEETAKLLGGKK